MKRDYIKPTMQVVLLQHQSHLLDVSQGSKSIYSTDGFSQKEDGFSDYDLDM